MPKTGGLSFVPGDKNKPRIPHYPLAGPVGVGMVTDQNKSRDGSINELAASIASKLARNAPIDPEPSDPPKGDGLICQSEREDDKISPPQEATTVMHNQPPYRKESLGRISRTGPRVSKLGTRSLDRRGSSSLS